MIKVLFVCLGNICRSPLAEAIFNQKLRESGLESKIIADSAGTSNYHIGDDPDHRTIHIAVKKNIPISHKGRQLNYQDGNTFDYILAMDAANYRDILHELADRHEGLYLMRYFDPEDKEADVPDPYWSEQDGFETVYNILDRSLDEFLAFLKENHDL